MSANKWQSYDGNYEKIEYDVKTKNGIVENCWPNAGNFWPLLVDGAEAIDGKNVVAIKPSKISSYELMKERPK